MIFFKKKIDGFCGFFAFYFIVSINWGKIAVMEIDNPKYLLLKKKGKLGFSNYCHIPNDDFVLLVVGKAVSLNQK